MYSGIHELHLDHMHTLTDETGIFQHARGRIPDRRYGYCTDDNARALIATARASQLEPERTRCQVAATRYMSFLAHAFNSAIGRFRNLMSYERRWLDEAGSDDCHGRAIWSLGEVVARREADRGWAEDLLLLALPALEAIQSPRSIAYALLGLHACTVGNGSDESVCRSYQRLSLRLAQIFNQRATEGWPWPEDRLTYANARLAQSLLLAGQDLNEEQMIETGVKTLAWLLRIQTSTEGHFSPVGNQGWYPKGGARARYGQQPIEAGATAEACIAAWQATGDSAWLDRAQWCMAWFLGDNDGGHPMIDVDTFGCYDGLYAEGINRNQGAESVLSWILATLSFLEVHVKDRSEQQDVV